MMTLAGGCIASEMECGLCKAVGRDVSDAWASERQESFPSRTAACGEQRETGPWKWVACGSSPSLCCPLWCLLCGTSTEPKCVPSSVGLGGSELPYGVGLGLRLCTHVPCQFLVPWLPWLHVTGTLSGDPDFEMAHLGETRSTGFRAW